MQIFSRYGFGIPAEYADIRRFFSRYDFGIPAEYADIRKFFLGTA